MWQAIKALRSSSNNSRELNKRCQRLHSRNNNNNNNMALVGWGLVDSR
jgi:hypothetical protein